MKLDTVLTVAIGDRDTDGQRLSPTEWVDFQNDMLTELKRYGTVVAHAEGDGVGSDGPNEAVDEATAVFIVINPRYVLTLRRCVADVARAYGQSSVCFAIDQAHEPVFTATRNGSRPLTPTEAGFPGIEAP